MTFLSPSDIIIFGGTGDLALRKILPALYYRYRDGQLPPEGRVIGIGRKSFSSEEYIEIVKNACAEYVKEGYYDPAIWDSVKKRICYLQIDGDNEGDFHKLKEEFKNSKCDGRIFYLSTPSEIFGKICLNLHKNNLITARSKVVLEKPLGYNLDSFKKINAQVLEYFNEKQVYRIDHYLGKETVQNLMILRFANNLFEKMWNRDTVDHIQITVSETVGVGQRIYDTSGALRDMVQNHLLQLLCLVAMEPPSTTDPDAIRDEKLKVLNSLKPIGVNEVESFTVRGQYLSGKINGEDIPSYTTEVSNKNTETETFVAIKTYIDNWRWSGVPFYLRTGKRLSERYSEIVIHFRHVPHQIFSGQNTDLESNKLIIRLQPDESVKLQMTTKIPGPGGYRLKPVNLNLSFSDTFEGRIPGAYERLLMDVVRGNPTLFMRSDEVEAAWKWIDSILNGWKANKQQSKSYAAGSDGPYDAVNLMEKDGRKWHHGAVAR